MRSAKGNSMQKEGNIILFDDVSEKKKTRCRGVTPEDITELLKEAVRIGKNIPVLTDDEIAVFTEKSARLFFYSHIIDTLKEKKAISSTLFHCTSYVADLLVRLFSSEHFRLTAFGFWEEYAQSYNPYLLQRGGDACFVVSSLFSDKGTRRTMKTGYYQDMGARFYHSFYSQTLRPIGFYMGENFALMSDVTNECVSALRIDSKSPR